MTPPPPPPPGIGVGIGLAVSQAGLQEPSEVITEDPDDFFTEPLTHNGYWNTTDGGWYKTYASTPP